VFGGSFNPPHLGHTLALVFAQQVYGFAGTLVIPAGRHAFGKPLVDAGIRWDMCRAAFNGLPGFVMSSVEIEAARAFPDRPSYMIDTISRLMQQYPDRDLRLVLGTDLMNEVPRWRQGDKLLELAPPCWIPRAGCPPAPGLAPDTPAIPNVSSSEIRARLAKGEPLDGWVPRDVLALIRRHRLYETGA